MVASYTDPTYKAHWKKMQNGHYIPRQYKYTRWHEDNMRPQSYVDNVHYGGKVFIYRQNLVAEIGEDRVKAIETLAKKLFTEDDDFIIERINYFKDKLEGLSETTA